MNINLSEKPDNFNISIQGGMLEALGINMYSTLGKCIVEFVANSYDADACRIDISIPFETINQERQKVREAVKKEVEMGLKKTFTLLTLPLPENIEVVLRDDGHGMAPVEIEKKFLPFNRNRRLDETTHEETNTTSESKKRKVMGRKGLGKLAGFGAAELVIIRTKRENADFFTEFRLDYEDLKANDNISEASIIPTYHADPNLNTHWTEITLAKLKCDAVKYGESSFKTTLLSNFFGVRPEDFSMFLNDELISEKPPVYEYNYPETADHSNLAEHLIAIDGIGNIPFKYLVQFRQRGDHLAATKRGARIYCNNRLAGGPSLFNMPTGMHGFHNLSYMECIVQADEFDRMGVDLINTNRTQLKEDNEAVSIFLDEIGELMKAGVAGYSKFRDNIAEEEIKQSPTGAPIFKILDNMPSKTRTPAKSIIKKLAADHGTESDAFREIAPLVINSMNSGEVLIRLIELGTNPEDFSEIADTLKELADIEKNDALKLYRGRKNGIKALTNLKNKGKDLWNKKGIESELQALLKDAPWLIRPEFGQYACSDDDLEKVYSRIAIDLKIDEYAKDKSEQKKEELRKRPDLVFVAGPAHSALGGVVVVELKSPSIPLTDEHLQQLEHYVNRVEDWLTNELKVKAPPVKGYLIGKRGEAKSQATGVYNLRKREEKAGPETMWVVKDMEQLLDEAKQIHLEEIKALEKYLEEEDEA